MGYVTSWLSSPTTMDKHHLSLFLIASTWLKNETAFWRPCGIFLHQNHFLSTQTLHNFDKWLPEKSGGIKPPEKKTWRLGVTRLWDDEKHMKTTKEMEHTYIMCEPDVNFMCVWVLLSLSNIIEIQAFLVSTRLLKLPNTLELGLMRLRRLATKVRLLHKQQVPWLYFLLLLSKKWWLHACVTWYLDISRTYPLCPTISKKKHIIASIDCTCSHFWGLVPSLS